jgi:hypothetical protein
MQASVREEIRAAIRAIQLPPNKFENAKQTTLAATVHAGATETRPSHLSMAAECLRVALEARFSELQLTIQVSPWQHPN